MLQPALGVANHMHSDLLGRLHDLATWYGINYTGRQITQWDFQDKGTLTSLTRLSFVLKVPLRLYLRPSIIYSVQCDRIVQWAYLRKTVWIRLAAVRRQYRWLGDTSGYSSAHPSPPWRLRFALT